MTISHSFLVLLTVFAVAFSVDREAADGEFPFQVSIKTENNRHLCGGAIIAPKWILTGSNCVASYNKVKVSYGSIDSNNPENTIYSFKIELQRQLDPHKKNSLALIELENNIPFSKTASQAKLPTPQAKLRNSTKLSGWKLYTGVDVPPNLHVIDKYNLITEDCRTPSGAQVTLAVDEFCGIDEDSSTFALTNPGTIVSKSAIVLGLLAQHPLTHVAPVIFVKVSEHDQWIKDVLGNDAQYITWADSIPKDSAHSQCAVSLGLLGLSAVFLRYL